ncbi:MAG: Fur family transcriptional regulator [Trueperaceae bacterium]
MKPERYENSVSRNRSEPTRKAAQKKASQRPEAEIREVLKDHGLRYSRPREIILGYLLERDRHVSAESLYVDLKGRGKELSLSTVYLNLSTLAEAGLVREYKTAAGQSFYDSNVTPHYHVVCHETGEVLDVPAPEINGVPLGRFLKAYVEELTGWQVDEPRFSLTGVSPQADHGERVVRAAPSEHEHQH